MSSERMTLADLPVVDLKAFLEDSKSAETDCKSVYQCLRDYGIVIVRDPRVSEADNDEFVDLMERYFEQSDEEKAADIHPELHYQIGATPSGVEHARDHCEMMKSLDRSDDRPVTECPPGADPKWRFFHRIGPRPAKDTTEFPDLNVKPVVPGSGKFPEWTKVMDSWGTHLVDTVFTVSEMLALGITEGGLAKDTFTSLLNFGPHLLAPTGSDLKKWGKVGTVFASFHYDLNFLTIHGRSRFPGLFVWLRDGSRAPVKVPAGCLLLQAGKQLEYLTGGDIKAGFHEVVVSEATLGAIEKARSEERSLWRVSSTLFSHTQSDKVLTPLGKFATEDAKAKYPAIKAGHQVLEELKAINLSSKA